MTLAAVTFPRAFAVRFKDTRVWSVGSFVRVKWNWPEEYIKPLSKALHRRVEDVDRKQHSIEDLQLVTLHFDGTIEPRERGSQKDFKGRLFFAYTGDVVYSKIDVRNGAIGVVPPQMPRVAASSEYPIYAVAPDTALPSYIQLLFRTSYFRRAINSMISGASGRKRVQPGQIEAIRVPLPPLPAQHAILKRWDEAQREITIARHRISTLEKQIEADFLADLGLNTSVHTDLPKAFAMRWKNLGRWGVDINQGIAVQLNPSGGKYPIVSLAEVIADLENGWSPKCLDRPARGDEWGVLKMGAVSFGLFNERENKALPNTLAPRPELEVKPGDFLISRANITRLVGACALVHYTRPTLMLCDKIFRAVWRDPSPVDKHYLDEILKTPHVRQQIENGVTGTSATMKNITKPALLALRFPLPPHDVQRQLVEQIIHHREEIAKKTERIYHLETAIGQEIEEMILGTRPVPEFEGLQKGTA